MLKKTIKYRDYNDKEQEETFYFHLNKAEVAEMELTAKDGLEAKLNQLIHEDDREEIIKIFKDIILKSVGQKSFDGKRFIKTEEFSMEFYQSEAYVELFMELVTNPEAAKIFFEGVIPQLPADNPPPRTN